MLEQRQHPLTGQWIVIASDRSGRPNDFLRPNPIDASTVDGQLKVDAAVRSSCPFCCGNEAETPTAVLQVDAAGNKIGRFDSNWQIRSVPNRFPAFLPDAAMPEVDANAGNLESELFIRQPPVGSHEVIIESPNHLQSPTELSVAELSGVLNFYRRRLADLAADGRWQFAQLFKNRGRLAGASLEHIHSQCVALPTTPDWVRHKLAGAERWFHSHGKCYFCQSVEAELTSQIRIISQSQNFVAFCPFASRCAYETWIVPKLHQCHFADYTDFAGGELAGLLRQVLRSLEDTQKTPAYNLTIQTSPFDINQKDYYHWHIEIIPRISTLAGFEWGTGVFINTKAPEDAAAELRSQAG